MLPSKPIREKRPLKPSIWCLPLILLLASSSTCGRPHNPQADFDHAFGQFQHGDLLTAQKEADAGYERVRLSGGDWAWKFIVLRGRILYQRGLYEETLKVFASGPSPPPAGELEIQKLRVEGLAYVSLNQFSEAQRRFQDAGKLCLGSALVVCAKLDNANGNMAMAQGHYAEAQRYFERVLSSARASQDAIWQADALLDLSWSANQQAHYDEVLDWAGAASDISLSHNVPDDAQKALGDAGWAYYKLGDSEKAEGMFLDAGTQAEKIGDISDQMQWLQASSYVYLDEGKIVDADRTSRRSLELATKTNSKGDIINSVTVLAFVSERLGKLEVAQNYADQALSLAREEKNEIEIVFPLLIKGRIAHSRHDFASAENAFHQVEQSKDTPVSLKWEAERSLAHTYQDQGKPEANAEYRAALDTFEAARCGLRRVDTQLPFPTNAARIYDDYIHFLIVNHKENDALRVADYARARTLSEGLGRPCKAKFAPDPLNPAALARYAGGTILFYALGEEHSYLWAITPQQIQMYPLAANRAEIEAAVQRYRRKLEGPRETLAVSNDGSTLYQMLIAPAQSLLEKEARAKNTNIFIIPDGDLNSLNFETLQPQPSRYWIEDFTISNAASLRLLPTQTNATPLQGKLLLIGNPVSPTASSEDAYPELPNSAAQMHNVQKYFPLESQSVFERQQASPAAYLKNHPEQFSYIHFVAHGTASRTSPLDSAIILSGNPAFKPSATVDDSFKLYARDIIAMSLRAQLVTISACYSTGKRTYSGEGLVGLSWAFLRSGAHNVVAALWDVSDASTPEIMDDFYGELKKGRTPGAALRTAKLAELHGDQFKSPFYWAPFQLYVGK